MTTADAPLLLHMHPLAAYCWKVLIALRENDVSFTPVVPTGASRNDPRLTRLWPFGKIPVLEDVGLGAVVAETPIIIDYLQQYYPGPVRLIPNDLKAAREARLWDRFADLYLAANMQKIVGDRLRPEGVGDAYGVQEAKDQLDIAYAMLERRMEGREWLAGEVFGLADCAALPPLFFLEAIHPFRAHHPAVSAYMDRLLARPSVRETIRAAQPYFQFFPFADGLEARFLSPGL